MDTAFQPDTTDVACLLNEEYESSGVNSNETVYIIEVSLLNQSWSHHRQSFVFFVYRRDILRIYIYIYIFLSINIHVYIYANHFSKAAKKAYPGHESNRESDVSTGNAAPEVKDIVSYLHPSQKANPQN